MDEGSSVKNKHFPNNTEYDNKQFPCRTEIRNKSMDIHLLSSSGLSFEPDSGPSPDNLILSSKVSATTAAYHHPGKINDDDTTYTPHSVFSSFGKYADPCFSLFCARTSGNGILEKYGIGIITWFKLLKAFSVIFLGMFFITLIPLLFFMNGDAISLEKSFRFVNSPERFLTITTMGNLGEPSPFCYKIKSFETINIQCPNGGVVSNILSYYGNPKGFCSCPANQLPSNGVCPGSTTATTIFSSDNDYSTTCSRSSDGDFLPCHLTTLDSPYSSTLRPCCVSILDNQGRPDTSNLKISASISCNSDTAQIIVEGLCLGRSQCSLTADPNYVYSWSPQSNPSSTSASSIYCTSNSCNARLGQDGLWSGCANAYNRELVIQGACTAENVTFNSYFMLSKKDIVFYASLGNISAMLIFLFGIYWVRLQQEKDAKDIAHRTCNVSDYSVQLVTDTIFESQMQLKECLTQYLEESLSETWPVMLPGPVRVANVSLCMGSHKYWNRVQQRGKCAMAIDDLQNQKKVLLIQGKQTSMSFKLCQRALNNLEKKIIILNHSCNQLWEKNKEDMYVNRIYITFETEEGRLRCLRKFSNTNSQCWSITSKKSVVNIANLTKESDIRVIRPEIPEDINFEAISIPVWEKALRLTLTGAMWLLLLAAAYLLTYQTQKNFIGAGSTQTLPGVDCSMYTVNLDPNVQYSTGASEITYNKVLLDYNWAYYNNSVGNSGLTTCFCLALLDQSGLERMKSHQFFNMVTSKQENWCAALLAQTEQQEYLRLAIAASLVFSCLILPEIIRRISHLEMYVSKSAYSTFYCVRIYLTQFLLLGALLLIMFGKPSWINGKIGYPNFIAIFNGSFTDFSQVFYEEVGTIILMSMILYSLAIHIKKFLLILLYKIRLWYDRYYSSNIHLTRQFSQHGLNKLYLGPKFTFESRYAAFLTLTTVAILYGSTMPILYLIVSLSLRLFYFVDKFMFLKVCQKPPISDGNLSTTSTFILSCTILLNIIFGIYAYGYGLLYSGMLTTEDDSVTHQGHTYLQTNQFGYTYSFYERTVQKVTLPFWGLLIAILVGFFLVLGKRLVMACYRRFFRTLADELKDDADKACAEFRGLPDYFDAIPSHTLQRRVFDSSCSASILRKYQDRLSNNALSNYAFGSNSKHTIKLLGLESYDINVMDKYVDAFGLTSPRLRELSPSDLCSLDFVGPSFTGNRASDFETVSRIVYYQGVERETLRLLSLTSPVDRTSELYEPKVIINDNSGEASDNHSRSSLVGSTSPDGYNRGVGGENEREGMDRSAMTPFQSHSVSLLGTPASAIDTRATGLASTDIERSSSAALLPTSLVVRMRSSSKLQNESATSSSTAPRLPQQSVFNNSQFSEAQSLSTLTTDTEKVAQPKKFLPPTSSKPVPFPHLAPLVPEIDNMTMGANSVVGMRSPSPVLSPSPPITKTTPAIFSSKFNAPSSLGYNNNYSSSMSNSILATSTNNNGNSTNAVIATYDKTLIHDRKVSPPLASGSISSLSASSSRSYAISKQNSSYTMSSGGGYSSTDEKLPPPQRRIPIRQLQSGIPASSSKSISNSLVPPAMRPSLGFFSESEASDTDNSDVGEGYGKRAVMDSLKAGAPPLTTRTASPIRSFNADNTVAVGMGPSKKFSSSLHMTLASVVSNEYEETDGSDAENSHVNDQNEKYFFDKC